MVWIARDKNGDLKVYSHKPKRLVTIFNTVGYYDDYFEIDNKLYPEVTWENSPKELIVNT